MQVRRKVFSVLFMRRDGQLLWPGLYMFEWILSFQGKRLFSSPISRLHNPHRNQAAIVTAIVVPMTVLVSRFRYVAQVIASVLLAEMLNFHLRTPKC